MSYAYQRGPRFYLAYRDATGRLVRVSSKAARTLGQAKKLALEAELEAERERLGIARPKAKKHTWDELCERYSADVVPNHKSKANTESQMRLYVARAFKGRALTDIVPGDIDRFVTGLRKKGLKDSSREVIRMRVSAILTYAVKGLRWLHASPMADAARVSVPKVKPKHMNAEEVRALVMAAPPWLQPIVAASLFLGLRKGEVCGLRKEDVDLPGRLVHVRHSYAGTTKTGRERSVIIPDECAPFLELALKLSQGSEYVFPANHGGMRSPKGGFHKAFSKALAAAGVKGISFRHTRSTWATTAYAATGDIRFVQKTLGHSKVETTAYHYADVLPEHFRAQANRLTYGLHTLRTVEGTQNEPARTVDGKFSKQAQLTGGETVETDKVNVWGNKTGQRDGRAPYASPEVTSCHLVQVGGRFQVVARHWRPSEATHFAHTEGEGES